jgi:DNA polymerase-1
VQKNKLFLLDAFALIFRAHFAFVARPLINSKGQNVSAITGFLNSLRELISKEGATHIAVCFDLPGGTFRNEMYAEYKANRQETPEDIIFAAPWIKVILQAMNIPIYSLAGYEADDVAGAIAKQADELGIFDEIYLFTPDKDYGQLVTETVKIMKPARLGNEIEVLGIKEVCEVWGIERIEQVIDCLGLQGDAVDNIPGVPGIGPKTAQKLLAEFGSIENLLQNLDKLKGKNRESLEKFADQAILSKKLATIDVNVPVTFNADDCLIGDFNYESLDELFKELEFRTLTKWADDYKRKRAAKGFKDAMGNEPENNTEPAKQKAKNATNTNQFDLFGGTNDALPEPDRNIHASNNITNTPHEYICVQTPEKIEELVALLENSNTFCFDTETTGLDPNEAELVGMSFAVKTGVAYYVPVPSNKETALAIVSEFKAVFQNETIAKIGQNLKYDMLLLRWYGVEVQGELWDTMLMHYLLEPELKHNMNYLAETYLKYAPIKIETLIGEKGLKQRTMRSVAVERVVDYAAEDADITLQLFNYLYPKLKESGDLLKLYTEIEAPLIQVLTDIEFEGVNVDAAFLQKYSIELEKDILAFRSKIFEISQVEFNVDSPKQVGEILFDRLKIPYKGKKTKLGAYSTDEEKLSELAEEYPIAQRILDYRSLQKLRSTYVDALPKQVNPKTGRVHTSYNQFLASTGRLSSNNPNLQNIPIRTPQGREVRKAFIARNSDYTILSADYSQIELRLIAEISHDESMLEAFRLGQDIHQATAAKVYNTPLDEVTSDQRRNAKTVNFSIVYGAGARNVAQQLNISNSEAKVLIDSYFKTYSGLKNYMKTIVDEAREKGYVTTLVGRRRRLRDIHSQSAITRAAAERTAVNSPIQGSAADLIKIAMINIYKILKTKNMRSKMILQVHDELVFDVYKDELNELKTIVSHEMRHALPNLSVPLEVGIGQGANWLDAH